jgi:hypothetical protein
MGMDGVEKSGGGFRESLKRRGLLAAAAALAAAMVGKVADREPDVAYAADFACDNLSVNGNVTFTNP